MDRQWRLPSQDCAEVLFKRGKKLLPSQRSADLLTGTQPFYIVFSSHSGEEGSPVGGQLE
jgi:hypothetical protein